MTTAVGEFRCKVEVLEWNAANSAGSFGARGYAISSLELYTGCLKKVAP